MREKSKILFELRAYGTIKRKNESRLENENLSRIFEKEIVGVVLLKIFSHEVSQTFF